MHTSDIIQHLNQLSGDKPNANRPFHLGIKLGPLRAYAKTISSLPINWEGFDHTLHFELNLIRGMIMAYSPTPLETQWEFYEKYFTWATDWAYVDCVVVSLPKRINIDQVHEAVHRFATSPFPYVRRFAFVLTLRFLIKTGFLQEILNLIDPQENEYHVYMAIAWLLAECYIQRRDIFVSYMQTHKLSLWIRQKTVSKIRDSFRVSALDKLAALIYKKQE